MNELRYHRPYLDCIWKTLNFSSDKNFRKASIISPLSEHGKIMRIASLSFGWLSSEALLLYGRVKGALFWLNETDLNSDFKAYSAF